MEECKIRKVIIPVAGLATRFLPLSKAFPKEFLPLVDKPLIQYAIEEIRASGIKGEVIFVVRPKKKGILEYFEKEPVLEKILKDRKKQDLLTELGQLSRLTEDLSFLSAVQKKPLGDGDAVLQAEGLVRDEACAVLFPDDVIDSETPCILQLARIFKTCQKPVIALKKMPKEKISRYGVVRVEKIAHRLYKIKQILEKPSLQEAPSDFAITGRYIITPEVFDYLRKTRPDKRGEVILANAFDKMAADGKLLYGYEFEGEWLECGDKLNWLKSNLHLCLKHPQFGKELREYLREML